jgi:hypothetical protein
MPHSFNVVAAAVSVHCPAPTEAGALPQSAKSSADYKHQLAAVDALLDLVDPHGQGAISVEQIWEAQAGQATAVAQYIDFAQQCLNMNLSLLADIPQKINFSKQRISQAEKLLVLTAANSKVMSQPWLLLRAAAFLSPADGGFWPCGHVVG